MISIDGLTVEFSGTTLFKDISFTIGDKDRIALMGKNGAGKSTLLKIIAGVRSATRGRVTVGEGGKVGYLPQHLQVEDGRTLVEEASRAFEHLFEIERRIAALNEQLYGEAFSVVYTSATMTVNGTFDAFEESIGLGGADQAHATTLVLDSSYDFDNNMAIYVINDIPEPNEARYLGELQKLLIEAHRAQRGWGRYPSSA